MGLGSVIFHQARSDGPMGVQMPPNIDLGILVILCVQDPFVPPQKNWHITFKKKNRERGLHCSKTLDFHGSGIESDPPEVVQYGSEAHGRIHIQYCLI
jgi:hypothetical protein